MAQRWRSVPHPARGESWGRRNGLEAMPGTERTNMIEGALAEVVIVEGVLRGRLSRVAGQCGTRCAI